MKGLPSEIADYPTIILSFQGEPAPGGSKIIRYGRGRRPWITDDCKRNKSWRDSVALQAIEQTRNIRHLLPIPKLTPIRLTAVMKMPRRKEDLQKDGFLKKSARHYHVTRPDYIKLMRSTEDALTGIIWEDDAQICEGSFSKVYGDRPGVMLVVSVIKKNAI